jgi:ADP-heptose:LPS heptosyltransferase
MTISQPVRRVLLVALDNLGDLVFASALTPPIHAAYPTAVIDVWAKDYTADVARLIPHVRSVHAANPFWAASKAHARPRIGQFVRSIVAVRNSRYDVAILSEAPWRTAAAVAATRTPVRIGLARHRNSIFLTHMLAAVDEVGIAEPARAEMRRYFDDAATFMINNRTNVEDRT